MWSAPIFQPMMAVHCGGSPMLKYFGIFIVRARIFRCSLNYVKRSFFGAVNGLFEKLLNLASETVILELVRSKCMPIICSTV